MRGDIQLHISENALEVKIYFTADPGGKEWSPDDIIMLLSREGVVYGYTKSSIEQVFRELKKQIKSKNRNKAEEPVSVTAALGDAPGLGVMEEYDWEELPVPEKLKEIEDKYRNLQEAPEIYEVAIEKVKIQKKALKKSKLLFIPDKEEVVEETVKKEVPKRVYVNPEVISFGWAEKNTKLAAVYPAKPSKPGKDVYGKPVVPELSLEPSLYVGKGVEKTKGELLAQETGFVRRGDNWVELIPFQLHTWELTLSKDKGTCFLTLSIGSPEAPLPSAEEILSEAKNLEFPGEMLIEQEEIDDLIRKSIQTSKPMEKVSIVRNRDASVEITVSEDALKAVLTIQKGRGKGKALDLKEVGAALRTCGLKGIKIENVKKDILEFYRGPAHDLIDYVLVEGIPPEKAGEYEVSLTAEFPPQDKISLYKEQAAAAPSSAFAGITSFSEFPLEKVVEMVPVIRHHPVARIIPPKPGKPGKDVYGKNLDTPPPSEPPVKLFENLKIDNNTIVAERGGILDKALINGILFLRVRPHKDGKAEIEISDDKMQAFLSIQASEGTGIPVSLEEINEKIEDAGIKNGVNEDRITVALGDAGEGKGCEKLVIAEGLYPKDGKSNSLELLVQLASGSKVTIRENGSADYKNQDMLTLVRKGQPVGKLLPPDQKPENGWNILGAELKAKDITLFNTEIGDTIHQQEEEDGSVTLIARIDGELFYDRKRLDVINVHTVDGNVNLKTGNIKFLGNVVIKGTVENGFQVISGGGVQIGEAVEGALISAEKDVTIGHGIKGGGKAAIRTKGTIIAAFAENARLLAVENISLKSYTLRCKIKTNGKLILGTDKGNCIGGEIKARKGIEVGNLGSEQYVNTIVSFGQDFLVADQIELEEREVRRIKNKLVKFDIFMKGLEKKGDKKNLERVRKEKLKFLKILEKRSLRLFNLREKYEEHVPSEIIIHGAVFPGVIFESHGRIHEIKKKKTEVAFYFDQKTGHIRERQVKENSKE